MTNPYFWPFPQRNETMYMSTLGSLKLIQKINLYLLPSIRDSPPFFSKILMGLVLSNRYHRKYLNKVSYIPLSSSRGLNIGDQFKKKPILSSMMIQKAHNHKQLNLKQKEISILYCLDINCRVLNQLILSLQINL